MDNRMFDDLARGFAQGLSRRQLLGVTLGAGFSWFATQIRPGATEAAVLCAFPQEDCGDGCTNLQTDEQNCGECGNVCDNSCFGGFCLAEFCLLPEISCGGVCLNPTNDPNNCGECGNVCDFGCIAGNCIVQLCLFPEVMCDGECVNTADDPENCGECGIVCANGCIEGLCLQIACLIPSTLCGDECVILDTDPLNCGECGNVCNDLCVEGECVDDIVCLVPGFPCGDQCVDRSIDVNNCGACGNVCEGGVPAPGHSSEPACADGLCISPCLPGADFCGTECTDFDVDPLNCGGCNVACAPGELCCGGVCRGEGDAQRFCDNCGLQGGWPQGCLGDEVCDGGICIPDCPTGQITCENSCVDLSSDSEHCGECGNACDEEEECNEGSCGPPDDSGEPGALWQGETKLRGANILQWDARATGDEAEPGQQDFGLEYTAADFEALADLGANVVVINHPAIFDGEVEPAIDDEAADNLDQLVTMAADAGLYSVVALRTGPGYPESALAESILCRSGGCPPAEDEPPASTSLFEDADAQESWRFSWQEIASRYQNEKSVIGYQLMSWVDPAFSDDWAPVAESWIETIRGEDEDKPILVPVPGWPEENLAEPLTDDQNAIHVVQFFLPERYLTQSADESDPLTYPGSFDSGIDDDEGDFFRDWIERQLLPLAEFRETHDKPVAVSAFGAPRWQPGVANFIDDLMTAFEDEGFNHALWAWYPEAFEGDDAFDPTRGPDPENHDAVENDLLDVIAEHWGDDTEKFAPDDS